MWCWVQQPECWFTWRGNNEDMCHSQLSNLHPLKRMNKIKFITSDQTHGQSPSEVTGYRHDGQSSIPSICNVIFSFIIWSPQWLWGLPLVSHNSKMLGKKGDCILIITLSVIFINYKQYKKMIHPWAKNFIFNALKNVTPQTLSNYRGMGEKNNNSVWAKKKCYNSTLQTNYPAHITEITNTFHKYTKTFVWNILTIKQSLLVAFILSQTRSFPN